MGRVQTIPALLPPLDGDDEACLDWARLVVRGVIRTVSPRSVYLVRLDNWFGVRWLGFEFSMWGAGFHARDEREPAVIPPFVPSRVVEQTFLAQTAAGYEVREAPIQLHRRQHCTANWARKLEQLLPSSLIVWVSGNSLPNGRASLMAYVPVEDGHAGWHAELARDVPEGDWSLVEHRGIDAEMVRYYQEQGGP